MHFSSLNSKQEAFVTKAYQDYLVEGIRPDLKLLGKGEGGIVFKMGHKALKLSRGEDGSDRWIRFCIRHQGNPFVPKVHYFSQKRMGGPYVCVMEKLKPVGDGMGMVSGEVREPLEELKFQEWQKGWMSRRAAKLYDVWLKANRRPEFSPVKRYLSRYKNYLDMHTGNFMWRGRGKERQLVIVDPIFTGGY